MLIYLQIHKNKSMPFIVEYLKKHSFKYLSRFCLSERIE